jgi:hypothetical protein
MEASKNGTKHNLNLKKFKDFQIGIFSPVTLSIDSKSNLN